MDGKGGGEKTWVIKIKKRSQPEWLLWLIICLPFCLGLLNVLHLPWAIRYVLDIAWLLLLVFMLRFKRAINFRNIKELIIWVFLFFVCTLVTYIVQYQSALYYLWGVRNIFRFYISFFAVACFFTEADAEQYLELLDKLFWLNAVISLFQFFVMDLKGDYLGGIFGSEVGVNGYTNLFLSIVLTRSILRYLTKKESTWPCVAKYLTAFLVAVLAELKFFFIEALLIIAFAVLITNFTWRKLWIVLGGVTAIVLGAMAIAVLFPQFENWFSLKSILFYSTSDQGYTASGDLNRLNAIIRINEIWLKNLPSQLFGLGLGNCETASFSFLNTPFFRQYGHMHYSWIYYAQTYLETGWIGLVFMFGFFVRLYLMLKKYRQNCHGLKYEYCSLAMIVIVVCMIVSIYNNSLRMEAGYMAYIVLALPFVKETPNHKMQITQP